MKTTNLFYVFCLVFSCFVNAQVGIGTTNPNAQLDIRSTNQASPLNTDGLLIPKIDEFPTVNPTINQDGMFVYVTGSGSMTKGFYYWDNTSASWIVFSSVREINDLLDGKTVVNLIESDNPKSIYLGDGSGFNDTVSGYYNLGYGINALHNVTTGVGNIGIGRRTLYDNVTGGSNIAIGTNTLTNNLASENIGLGLSTLNMNTTGIRNIAIGTSAMSDNLTGDTNVSIGYQSLADNVDGDENVAIGRQALRYSDGNHNIALGYLSGRSTYGNSSDNIFIGRLSGPTSPTSTISGNIFIGTNSGNPETNSNRLYIENSNSTTPLIYGEFDNDLVRINGILDVNNAYQFPVIDGAANQVLLTNGAGNVSWSNISVGAEKIDDLLDGKSDSDGTNDGASVFLGVSSGINDDSNDRRNVGVGFNALISNLIGSNNVAIGHSALINNLSTGNTAVGYTTLNENISGGGNTALGNQALYFNQSGDDNVALGNSAMVNNGTGSFNVSVGTRAGAGIEGERNVFIGAQAGYSPILRNKSDGIYIGFNSGVFETNDDRLYIENSNSTNPLIYGEFDTDLLRINGTLDINNNYQFPLVDGTANQVLQTNGLGSLNWGSIPTNTPSMIIDADGDTKVDVEASPDEDRVRIDINGSEKLVMQSNTNNILRFDLPNNSNNILLGQNAGFSLNTSAFNNIAIGFRALSNTINGAQNMAIGSSALQNNIGTANTAVGYEAMLGNINGENNVVLGESAFRGNFNGSSNIAIGINSGGTINGNSNIFIGNDSTNGLSLRNLSGSVFIGHQSGFYETIDNRLYIENSSGDGPLIGGSFADRVVGINRDLNTISNAFEVNGDASKSTSGAWLANSDKRLKKDIESISGSYALEKISELSGVSYKWNDRQTGIDRPKHVQYGFIAQELMEVFPENVSQDKLGYYQTAYGNYDAFFVEAIKELKKQLKGKDDKIKSLEDRLLRLEAIVNKH